MSSLCVLIKSFSSSPAQNKKDFLKDIVDSVKSFVTDVQTLNPNYCTYSSKTEFYSGFGFYISPEKVKSQRSSYFHLYTSMFVIHFVLID